MFAKPSLTHFPLSLFMWLPIQPMESTRGMLVGDRDARALLSLFQLQLADNSNCSYFVVSSPMRQPLCLWSQHFLESHCCGSWLHRGFWLSCSQWAFLIVLLVLGVGAVSCWIQSLLSLWLHSFSIIWIVSFLYSIFYDLKSESSFSLPALTLIDRIGINKIKTHIIFMK